MSTDLDYRIGRRLRTRRRLLNLSQTQVARACGVTFQQIQKYESGLVSLSAARLWALARVLDVPITHFFDGLPVDWEVLRRPGRPPHPGSEVHREAPDGVS
jgi:transcriptional regulator with XRE-family HTH domain